MSIFAYLSDAACEWLVVGSTIGLIVTLCLMAAAPDREDLVQLSPEEARRLLRDREGFLVGEEEL